MSKLSFRARALDATKSMPIYRKDEVSDLPDYSVLNRAVPQMPTGMEKEEESEHHLQRAISAQQVYGDKKVMVIPVPEAEVGVDYYNNVYKKTLRLPKLYIHNQAQALNSIMEQEKPDYDMDSEDERWVRDTNKRTGLEIVDLQFEEMIDRLEKSCGNQVVSLQEAKLLLKEDDDLIKAVYDYWLQKRYKMTGTLNPLVRQEKRDGSSSGDSYVAFRRRTEKMQTRKNRKNDEASYEKMLKLRRDLSRAVTILEMIKRREKGKRELLHLTLEIVEKRYQMKDWDGKSLKMAKREVSVANMGNVPLKVRSKHISGNRPKISSSRLSKQKIAKLVGDRASILSHKKRRYKKNRHGKPHLIASNLDGIPSGQKSLVHSLSPVKRPVSLPTHTLNTKFSSPSRVSAHKPSVSVSTDTLPRPVPSSSAFGVATKSPGMAAMTYQQVFNAMNQYEFRSSDEEPKSPLSGSVAPEDDRKKGVEEYAMRRKAGCKYQAPRDDLSGDHWPWMTDDRHRYSLTTLTVPEKCMGFCRRRMGRGGRVLLDRAYTPWNKQLSEIDLNPEADHLPHKKNLQELLEEIKHGRWRRYRPYDPAFHKVHKAATASEDNRSSNLEVKSFGHTSTRTPGRRHPPFKESKHHRAETSHVSSDSETVDIMTTDESFRGDLLQKRLLLGSPNSKSSHSPQRHKSMTHKRNISAVPSGKPLDKSSAVFAVSALVSSASKLKPVATDSIISHKTKVPAGRVHAPLKLNVMSASSSSVANVTNSGSMTLIGSPSGTSPGRHGTSAFASLHTQDDAVNATPPKAVRKPGKFTLDRAKFFGVQAALMSVSCLNPNSTTVNSVTFAVSGTTSKVSLAPVYGTMISTAASTSGHKPLQVAGAQENVAIAPQTQRSSSMPVTVMATLRITNPSQTNLQSAIISNNNSTSQPTISSTYAFNSHSTVGDATSSAGTVFIAPTSRLQYPKAGDQIHNSASVPLSLSTVNSTVAAAQFKQGQQGLVLSHRPLGSNLNLALAPASPQKQSSQLSIPNTSGHSAVLIATPAAGSLASSLPSHCASGVDVGTLALGASNGGSGVNQTKTLSISVPRVQTTSCNVGQILTLQTDGNATGMLTPSSCQALSGQHSGTSWVTSGSGPNILKLGTGAGMVLQPKTRLKQQDAAFLRMSKKSIVIPNRMRQLPSANATRTISIPNSKQQGQTLNTKSPVASSHITLLSDGRNSLSKPLISIGNPQKNNATIMLAPKGIASSMDQALTRASDGEQISQTEATVSEAVAILSNKATKSNQPMEVT